MARYQYETSPRKQEPYYRKKKQTNFKVIENKKSVDKEKLKLEKQKRKNVIGLVLLSFCALLVISYRNSVIDEQFRNIQQEKNNLAVIEKENKQIEIGIESNLNLNNVEKIASEQLGMQKQTGAQTIYLDLPKQDYVETTSEIMEKESKNFFEMIFDLFK